MKVRYSIDPGTKFKCPEGCIECCTKYKVGLYYPEAFQIAQSLDVPLEKVTNMQTSLIENLLILSGTDTDKNCDYLESNGCSIHKIKPVKCRIYPDKMIIRPYNDVLEVRLKPRPYCDIVRRFNGKRSKKEVRDIAELMIKYMASQDIAFKEFVNSGEWELAEESFHIFKKISLEEAIKHIIKKQLSIESPLL